MNVDSKALKDPRFKRLGKELGVDWHAALGLSIVVWNYAYESRSSLMSADDVDAVVERDGFAKALLAADLAVVERSQLRLRGVDTRIGFLMKQAERGRAGGKARAAAQQAKKSPGLVANAKRTLKQDHSDLDQALDLSPDQPPDQDQPPLQLTSAPQKQNSSSAKRSRGGDVAVAIAFFCDRYRQKYGQPCTVTQRGAGQVKALEKRHGVEEVKRRTEILFTAPPQFLASSPPDLGTLAQHFDKLVVPSSRPNTPRNGAGRTSPATAEQHAADAANGGPSWMATH